MVINDLGGTDAIFPADRSEYPRAYWTGGVGGPNSAEGASFIGQGEHVAPAGVYNWKVQFPTFKGIETRQGKLSLIR